MTPHKAKRAPRKLRSSCTPDESLLEKMAFWLTSTDVAKVLGGCSRETVRALRSKGTIASLDFRLSDSPQPDYKFYKESVRQYLHARRAAQSRS